MDLLAQRNSATMQRGSGFSQHGSHEEHQTFIGKAVSVESPCLKSLYGRAADATATAEKIHHSCQFCSSLGSQYIASWAVSRYYLLKSTTYALADCRHSFCEMDAEQSKWTPAEADGSV